MIFGNGDSTAPESASSGGGGGVLIFAIGAAAMLGFFLSLPILIGAFLIIFILQTSYVDGGEKRLDRLLWVTGFLAIALFLTVGIFPTGRELELFPSGAKVEPWMLTVANMPSEWINEYIHRDWVPRFNENRFRFYAWTAFILGNAGFCLGLRNGKTKHLQSEVLRRAFLGSKEIVSSSFAVGVVFVGVAATSLCVLQAPASVNNFFAALCVFIVLSKMFEKFKKSLVVARVKVDSPSSEGVLIGNEMRGFQKKVLLSEADLNHHVHITGASGYGKSVLLSHIIENRIRNGVGLLFVDLKADLETIRQVQAQAAAAGRADDLMIFSCRNTELSQRYNPLAQGSATELRDRLILALNWSEEFYKNLSASYLLKILTGLCYIRDHHQKPFGLSEVFNCLTDPDQVEELAMQIPETGDHQTIDKRRRVESALRDIRDKETQKSLTGLKSQIESLIFSDFGKLLRGTSAGINLFEAMKSQKIIYVLLDSRSYGETCKSLGKLVIQDLKAASARVDNEIQASDRKPFTVVIDEFADMATEDFIGFLDRARSSKIGVVVAHQEIADLDRISVEFRKRLMNSASTMFAFLQKIPESSELIAAIAGTRKVNEDTEQLDSSFIFGNTPTGKKSRKQVDEFIIHPNTIRSLKVGECICIRKYPRSRASAIRVRTAEH